MSARKRAYEKLYPWQREWLEDQPTWKIALKCRQIGWTEIAAFESALHAVHHGAHTSYVVSTKVGNARRQLLEPIKSRWLPIIAHDEPTAWVRDAEVRKNYIDLPNGSSIRAEAFEPERLRGHNAASYWFDEFAFWPDRVYEAIEDAVWPQIQSPNNPNAVLRGFSTAWNKTDNLFYDIWANESGQYSQFSRHRVDIVEAVDRGYPLDIDEARDQIASDKWNREYLCQFAEFGDGFYSRQTLLDLDEELEVDPRAEYVLGVDLGQVNDFTTVVPLRIDRQPYEVPCLWLMRSTAYDRQAEIIDDLVGRLDPSCVVVDTTAHKSFPSLLECRARGVQWTREWKVQYNERLRRWTENGDIVFDFDDVRSWGDDRGQFVDHPPRQLLDDLCRVQQGSTAGGNPTYNVPTDNDHRGHADAWAGHLCAVAAADTEQVDAQHETESTAPDRDTTIHDASISERRTYL